MQIYLHTYVFTYIYIYVYVNAYVYIYIYVYIHLGMQVFMCIYARDRMHACGDVFVYACVHACMFLVSVTVVQKASTLAVP